MPRVAIYPGSFDPPTLGHQDIVQRGARLFDEIVVAVGNNPAKRYWFDADRRRALVADACRDVPNARVIGFSGLLVDTCREIGADVIVRGLRALSDFDLEFRNGLANRDMTGIETVFLLSEPRHIFVASSLVKEIAQNGGDVSRYVPVAVNQAIVARLRE